MTDGGSRAAHEIPSAGNLLIETNRVLTNRGAKGQLDDITRVKESLERYIGCPCFGNTNLYWVEDDPFCRPIQWKPNDLHSVLDPSGMLQKGDFLSSQALFAQRLLTNIYEKDLMFLPSIKLNWQNYQDFYSTRRRTDGELIQPFLENFLFGFLHDEIEVGGGWGLTDFRNYCEKIISETVNADSSLAKVVSGSQNPEAAAKFFIVQCASDFLSEASAMARNCLGSYGPYMSELFKILIDEYGYGVHRTKHSQAFVALMESVGLHSSIHYYWKFYTASSLSLVNYYHYICKNHGNFFKYLGALYYTESTLAYITKHQGNMLKSVLGESIDTFYFTEHNHIDMYHSKMVFDNLITPIVKQYGEFVLCEILAGFEEFKMLQEIADNDLYCQIQYNTNLSFWKSSGTEMIRNGNYNKVNDLSIENMCNNDINIGCHDEGKLLKVVEGNIEFISNPFCPIELSANEAIIIPKYIHHGYRTLSEKCHFYLYSLHDDVCIHE